MPSLPSAFLRLPLLLVPLLMASTGATAAALDEVVAEFLGGAVHAGLPTDFPAVALPAGSQVRVVGTLTAGNIEQVLLEAPDTIAASAALRAAYVAAGWTDLGTNSVVVMLCHAAHGSLQITPGSRKPGRLRVLHSNDNIFASSPVAAGCARPAPSGGQSWTSWLTELVPALALPPQTKPGMASGSRLTPAPNLVAVRAGSGGMVAATLNLMQQNLIEVPDVNIAGLDAHFAARLVEQDWQRDSGSSGQRSATSVWYKPATVAPAGTGATQDIMLAGTLTLQHMQDDAFHISFSLQGTIEVLPDSIGIVGNIVSSGCTPSNDPQIGIRGSTSITVTGSRICRR